MIPFVDLDTWAEIGETVRRNKLRTALTALGVFWGMFMLLIMLGFGNGLQKGSERNMGSYATNAVWVWGGRSSIPYKGHQPGRYTEYDNGDTAALRAEVPGIELVCPRNQLGGWRDGSIVTRKGKTGSYQVMGDIPEFAEVQPIELREGRFLNALDLEQRRKVAAIGATVAKELFEPGESAVGELIEVNGVYFQVVGVFGSPAQGDQGDRQNGTLHVPFSTFQRAFNTGDRVGWFAIVGAPEVDGAQLEDDVRAVLAERHDLHPEDEPAIGSYNQAEGFGRMQALFGGIRVFVSFVGGVTLLSGIVGVSNIMMIAVRERTREIGVRRALGATPASIILLILREAVVITAVAGYAGLLGAVGVLELVSKLVGDSHEVLGSPQVDLSAAAIAGVVLVIGGVVAGFIPARQAARVDPVVALRAE
ncbi:MAG: ABC transporter permease [Alphaproteobacteria bacterium]|nr:ABC transporter permease [Alphaproteobacteria bacterium]